MDVPETIRASLDAVKRLSPSGVEYWTTRELQAPLGYAKWENFEGVIKKAQMACESTGVDPSNHILATRKMVGVGSGAERERRDHYVSRYGAYLIAMNGDPRLPQIAAAQIYFAIQTRRQELADQVNESRKSFTNELYSVLTEKEKKEYLRMLAKVCDNLRKKQV